MVNFGPLAAEIFSLVWGTPGNFNGFCVLAVLLHGTVVVGVSQTLRRWTVGAPYIRQGGHHVWHWPTFLVIFIYFCNNEATGYAIQHIWCLSQTRINWDGCDRKGIRRKNGDDWCGSLIGPDGVALSRILVFLPLFFPCPINIKSRRRFLVASAHPGSPGKRAIKWLYVCVRVCACVCVYIFSAAVNFYVRWNFRCCVIFVHTVIVKTDRLVILVKLQQKRLRQHSHHVLMKDGNDVLCALWNWAC